MIAEPVSNIRAGWREAAGPHDEIDVDLFAGGGGVAMGFESATRKAFDVAINHDAAAIEMHAANHPATRHLCSDVFEVNPLDATEGRAVRLLWGSPDCTDFSRAKGAKPVRKHIRGLAWVLVRWAREVRPRIIILENVREFEGWGPLVWARDKAGKWVQVRDPAREGQTFRRWKNSLRNLGYSVDWRVLNAADYGAPTHRRRLFIVARCDGERITWPEKTHGKESEAVVDANPEGHQVSRAATRQGRAGAAVLDETVRAEHGRAAPTDRFRADRSGQAQGLKPYRTAAECIDWSLPCPSIFDRKRPLAEKTLRRIAMGIWRYVINAADPFIVKINHGRDEFRGQPLDRPLTTITGSHGHAVVVPHLVAGYGERAGQPPRTSSVEDPLNTIPGTPKHALVAATLQQFYGGMVGKPLTDPMPAATAKGPHEALATAALVGVGGRAGQSPPCPVDEPMRTTTGKADRALASATLLGVGGAGYAAKPRPADEPKGAVMPHDRQAVAVVRLCQNGSNGSNVNPPEKPLTTITSKAEHCIASACLARFSHGEKQWNDVQEPLCTITSQGNKFGLVYAFLMKFYGSGGQWGHPANPIGTIPANDRFAVVQVEIAPGRVEPAVMIEVPGLGPHLIADIGLRMLTPRELFRAQGFPDSYILTGNKSSQVARCGNSVPPPLAEAVIRANVEVTEAIAV